MPQTPQPVQDGPALRSTSRSVLTMEKRAPVAGHSSRTTSGCASCGQETQNTSKAKTMKAAACTMRRRGE